MSVCMCCTEQLCAVLDVVQWKQYVLNSPLLRYELYCCTRDGKESWNGNLHRMESLTRSEAPNGNGSGCSRGKHVMVYFPDGEIAKVP